ncbi:MAG: hypothetical protein WCJ69_00160 [Betaproteobacteria bacterium]
MIEAGKTSNDNRIEDDNEQILLRADYLMRRHKGLEPDTTLPPLPEDPRSRPRIPTLTDLVSPGGQAAAPVSSAETSLRPTDSGGSGMAGLDALEEELFRSLRRRLLEDIDSQLERLTVPLLSRVLEDALGQVVAELKVEVHQIVRDAVDRKRIEWARASASAGDSFEP